MDALGEDLLITTLSMLFIECLLNEETFKEKVRSAIHATLVCKEWNRLTQRVITSQLERYVTTHKVSNNAMQLVKGGLQKQLRASSYWGPYAEHYKFLRQHYENGFSAILRQDDSYVEAVCLHLQAIRNEGVRSPMLIFCPNHSAVNMWMQTAIKYNLVVTTKPCVEYDDVAICIETYMKRTFRLDRRYAWQVFHSPELFPNKANYLVKQTETTTVSSLCANLFVSNAPNKVFFSKICKGVHCFPFWLDDYHKEHVAECKRLQTFLGPRWAHVNTDPNGMDDLFNAYFRKM